MRYEKTIKISEKEADQINKHLHVEPTCEEECLGEDIAIVNTVTFDNGIQMDIKCCGVQYNESDESNTAWAEAVLFQNGMELCCTEPEDEYLGEWILDYNGDEYVVYVEIQAICEKCKHFYECDNMGFYEDCLPEMVHYEENYTNTVHKILIGDGIICFIINTKGDKDFWYWKVERCTWDEFWKTRKQSNLDEITEKDANKFVNSIENSLCGDSCGNYATVEEAVAEYLRTKTN